MALIFTNPLSPIHTLKRLVATRIRVYLGFVKKRQTVIAIVILLLIAIGVLIYTKPNEAEYAGHPISYWLDVYYEPKALKAERKLATNAIQAIGAPSVSYCFNQFRKAHNPVQNFKREVFPKLPQFVQDRLPTPQRTNDAERRLGTAVGIVGDAGIPAIIEALDDRKPVIKCEALQLLKRLDDIGMDVSESVPSIIKLLDDEHIAVKIWAVYLLDDLKTVESIPHLVEIVVRRDPEISTRAARALGNIGVPSDRALNALRNLIEDSSREENIVGSDAFARIWAADAIWKLTGDSTYTVKCLTGLWNKADAEEKQVIVRVLGGIGAGASEAIPLLVELLEYKKTNAPIPSEPLLFEVTNALQKIDPYYF